MTTKLARIGGSGRMTTCSFDFLKRSRLYDTEKPYYFSGALEADQEYRRTNLDYEVHDDIQVCDLRGDEQQLDLESHGFKLLYHRPAVDLVNPSEVEMNKYLEDLATTVKNDLAAEVVLAYSFRFRREKLADDKVESDAQVGTYTNQDKPVLVPHTDQTRDGGLRRAERHMSEEERAKYLDGNWRIRILNCWRPLNTVADERPLAMCDYHSLKEGDLRSADRVSRQYVGEIYYLHHNPSQRWYWISGQSPEEMLLFTNYDSDPGESVPFMVHSSFVNLNAGLNVKRRESLETALIVVSRKQARGKS